ncbi:hypothetical protein CAPTEDRAFT_188570 [Capitella teleta]|uniref:Sushi domain-containing protein n=1 Tax=Capitella teleta TaxID=283909 RepID=R7UJ00_CAPTE|nr:hypothetical protein CAPTEDRAFT_188570 [Capitella teleta]|eukprot:ELU06043.1 hypothetical protein CAPTEDRAFT_188570 [Capitella teleta]
MDTNITVKCDEGLRFLDGYESKTIKCLQSEEWNETLTDCDSDRCPPLLLIANTTVDLSDASQGRVVDYNCYAGHHFQDGSYIDDVSCNIALTWDGYDDYLTNGCEPITCPEIPRKVHATASTENTVLGSIVTYVCEIGYEWPNASKPALTRCLTSAEWSLDEMDEDCQIVDCGPVHTVYNAWIEGSNTTYNSSFTFTAVREYWFSRGVYVVTTTCSSDGIWIPSIPHAIRQDFHFQNASHPKLLNQTMVEMNKELKVAMDNGGLDSEEKNKRNNKIKTRKKVKSFQKNRTVNPELLVEDLENPEILERDDNFDVQNSDALFPDHVPNTLSANWNSCNSDQGKHVHFNKNIDVS